MSEERPDDPAGSTGGWEAVLEDTAATAREYREDGWETLECRPGDSRLVHGDERTGLVVTLSGDEHGPLSALHDELDFSEVQTFRAPGGRRLYLLIVERAPGAETAVLIPAYYEPGRSREAVEAIREEGTVRLFCRRLDGDPVAFVHDDPAPFLPD